MVEVQECQFDSLVGLTHNYAGLAYGNVASAKHQNEVAFPRQAARQGLQKMWHVAQLGIPQAVLPPLIRPDLGWLRCLGFEGTDMEVLRAAQHQDRVLLATASSASSMWAANAATVSPSPDTRDGRVHLTIANLNSSLHRSLEACAIEGYFRQIFRGTAFQVHSALPAGMGLTDEGAANHTRLCGQHDGAGLELFVYGRDALNPQRPTPKLFPARQTLQACQAIARRHRLDDDNVFFLQQSPEAIDAGVFHNDVISVGNQNVLLVHQRAYVDQESQLARVADRFEQVAGTPLQLLQVSEEALSLEDAVSSYLFNSQLLTLPDGGMALICPAECQENVAAAKVLDNLVTGDNPIRSCHFLDLRQSMNNGGGPACLRLRVVMGPEQRRQVAAGVWLDRGLYQELEQWIDRFYPETLEVSQLADPALHQQSVAANRQLGEILGLDL